jgi:phosphate transport system ATP-binding protein
MSADSTAKNTPPPVVQVRDMDFCYGASPALFGINLKIKYRRVTALIGPSGCGKSTLLRCINRMNDRVPSARVTKGEVLVKGKNIHDADVDLTQLRKQVGMVFQKSNPFPKTIYENVAYGLRVHGVKDKTAIDEAVERSLTQAALWDELKDRLHAHALGLSGGQQQRLCIARAIATMPDVLLMDEPCSALDPIATLKIEELITQLARNYTVVIVTHNMQQAVRVSDFTAFLHLGKLVEFAPTEELFTNPREKLTDSYLRGTFS